MGKVGQTGMCEVSKIGTCKTCNEGMCMMCDIGMGEACGIGICAMACLDMQDRQRCMIDIMKQQQHAGSCWTYLYIQAAKGQPHSSRPSERLCLDP